MVKVIEKQYNSSNYPLMLFQWNDLPNYIVRVIEELNALNKVIIRGGLAYILLTKDFVYPLKDIDFIADYSSKRDIIKVLQVADIIYLNKNRFGDDVITAFWNIKDKYIKLDVLLCKNLPCIERFFYHKEYLVMAPTPLLLNKLNKIIQKTFRNHNDYKTYRHYLVAKNLVKYMLENNIFMIDSDVKFIVDNQNKIKSILENIISSEDIELFENSLNILCYRSKNENFILST